MLGVGSEGEKMLFALSIYKLILFKSGKREESCAPMIQVDRCDFNLVFMNVQEQFYNRRAYWYTHSRLPSILSSQNLLQLFSVQSSTLDLSKCGLLFSFSFPYYSFPLTAQEQSR
jgi:hypothetical protein